MFTLILPGLNWPHPEELPPLRTPALNRMLRFGRFTPDPATAADFGFTHLGVRLDRLFGEPYAFASPLHQQIGLHSAQLQNSGLNILPEEAEVLCHGLNAFCTADGWQFAPLSPELWSVRLSKPANWQSPCILNVTGHHADVPQAQGPAKKQWLQRQTEIQMWLHEHPVNTRRLANGQLPINAVWLWDQLPAVTDPAGFPSLIGSNSPWAAYSRCPNISAAPHDYSAWLAITSEHGTTIEHSALYLDDLQQAAELGHASDYSRILQQWDECFFGPVWQALQRNQLSVARIVTDGSRGGILHLHARSGWAFWKRKRRFAGDLHITSE